MKKIALTQGKFAKVDDSDYDFLNKWKWYAHFRNGWYAIRNISLSSGRQTQIKMHRIILDVPKGLQTDHKDGDGLNNQRNNLRVCTNSQNQKNKGSYRTNTSGFKGVSFNKKKWMARISVDGKRIHLGYFLDKVEAYKTYCDACLKYHGEFSRF